MKLYSIYNTLEKCFNPPFICKNDDVAKLLFQQWKENDKIKDNPISKYAVLYSWSDISFDSDKGILAEKKHGYESVASEVV